MTVRRSCAYTYRGLASDTTPTGGTHSLPVLSDVLAWHHADTRYGIRVDDDGLLRASEPGTQLTWMDAKVGDWVVTPRQGNPLIVGERAERILSVVEQRLLTPVGLRTLDPADPRYRGRCEGGVVERDGAYHQGTVWPWLLGPYGELATAGIGSLSEIHDGDPPHAPRGCIAQAWSVAELIRARAAVQSAPGAP